MNLNKLLILLIFCSLVNSCRTKQDGKTTNKQVSSNIELDHLNIWVNNPKLAKEKLTEIGFTSVPDSLSVIHKGQGTTGRYFYFLNGYLELIFVYNHKEFEKNCTNNQQLDFDIRSNFKQNGASPFSLALKLEEYDVNQIPFEKVKYHQSWMPNDANIYAAKNSKTHIYEPSIFFIYPEIKADKFETLEDLKNIPDEYAIWRKFFKHKNGAKKITNVVITSKNISLETKTTQTVNNLENVTIKSGKEHLMEIYFDNNIKEQSFDLRPELPLIIYI